MHSLRSHFKTLKVGNKRQQLWGKLGQPTRKTALVTVQESKNQNMFFASPRLHFLFSRWPTSFPHTVNLQSWEIRQVLHSFIIAIFFIYHYIIIISETTYIFRQIKRRKKRSQISMGSTSQRYKSNFNLLHHYSHCDTVSCILQKKSIESITRQKYRHPEKNLHCFDPTQIYAGCHLQNF